MIKILFVCVHNSARSQMTEEYTKFLDSDEISVESTDLEPGILKPYVIFRYCRKMIVI